MRFLALSEYEQSLCNLNQLSKRKYLGANEKDHRCMKIGKKDPSGSQET